MTRTNVLFTQRPTVVLVHGALTDASVWHGVTRRLLDQGIRVLAPALPLRGLATDATYLAGVVERAGGPVVLVGHSYAGSVISHPAVAATGAVTALVYVAAFQPDEGETAVDLTGMFPGSRLTPDNLQVEPNPLGGQDLTLRPERFAEVYAADVDPGLVAVLAVSQRPIDPAALDERLPGEPGWRTLPSWVLLSTQDNSLPPEVLRHTAKRAGSQVAEVNTGHASPISAPDAVVDLIRTALPTAHLSQP
jgi:pimeloyl-ACP methyl ester carboxylesterase